MELAIIVPLLVCVIGLLVYALAASPKIVEIGRIAYQCGLLVALFVLATRVIHL